MKPTVSLVLATDKLCNLRCKSCPTGRRENPAIGRMSADMTGRIIDKVMSEAHVLSCCLYYFNEPFLHPEIVEIVRKVKERGLYLFLSTNLNTMNNVKEVMQLKPDNLIVSVSGFTQEVYERSHKGGNIETVKHNMRVLAFCKETFCPDTFLRLSWHDYAYNQHERGLMKEYAEGLGYVFTPYCTSLLPLERALERWDDGQQDAGEEDLMVKVQDAKPLCYERRMWPCQMQLQTLTIGAEGEVYNCSDRNNTSNFRGNIFNRSVADILEARKTDEDCLECKKVGGHVYAAQAYTLPKWSFGVWADHAYRVLGLQAMFQKVAPGLWKRAVQGQYWRPSK